MLINRTDFLIQRETCRPQGWVVPFPTLLLWAAVLHLWVIALCSSFRGPLISGPWVHQMASPSPGKGVDTGCNLGQLDSPLSRIIPYDCFLRKQSTDSCHLHLLSCPELSPFNSVMLARVSFYGLQPKNPKQHVCVGWAE